MSQHASLPQNITMSGGVVYWIATKGAADVINLASDLVPNAVEDMKLPSELSVFRMTDMG